MCEMQVVVSSLKGAILIKGELVERSAQSIDCTM